MKRIALLATLIAAVGLTSCGSYSLRTITLNSLKVGSTTESTELSGIGGQLQLEATGNYSNYTSKGLTGRVTYNISITPGSTDANGFGLPTPPNGITVDSTGLITAVIPGVCTYNEVTTNPPTYVLTGSYTITATFDGITSNPVYIAMNSGAGPNGTCGP